VLDGEPVLGPSPLVVELRPVANLAAGEAEHSFAGVLAERLPGTRGLVVDERGTPPEEPPAVLVVRDAHRHPWMQELVERLSPGLVVEVGVPIWRPSSGTYVATHGGSRLSYEVVADELLAAVPA
jgi:beta-N-acetylhexosaminidase